MNTPVFHKTTTSISIARTWVRAIEDLDFVAEVEAVGDWIADDGETLFAGSGVVCDLPKRDTRLWCSNENWTGPIRMTANSQIRVTALRTSNGRMFDDEW